MKNPQKPVGQHGKSADHLEKAAKSPGSMNPDGKSEHASTVRAAPDHQSGNKMHGTENDRK